MLWQSRVKGEGTIHVHILYTIHIHFYSLLQLCSIPWYICTTSLFIHLSMDIQVISMSWLLSIVFYEQRGACIFMDYSFVWIYAQEWDCWIIWQLYFQFFEEPLQRYSNYAQLLHNLHSHQQYRRVPFSPYLPQCLLLVILTGVR